MSNYFNFTALTLIAGVMLTLSCATPQSTPVMAKRRQPLPTAAFLFSDELEYSVRYEMNLTTTAAI